MILRVLQVTQTGKFKNPGPLRRILHHLYLMALLDINGTPRRDLRSGVVKIHNC